MPMCRDCSRGCTCMRCQYARSRHGLPTPALHLAEQFGEPQGKIKMKVLHTRRPVEGSRSHDAINVEKQTVKGMIDYFYELQAKDEILIRSKMEEKEKFTECGYTYRTYDEIKSFCDDYLTYYGHYHRDFNNSSRFVHELAYFLRVPIPQVVY